MIAQYFPPVGGVGTFRVTKFVKYLREFGWEPVVLTVREDCYPDTAWLDNSLQKDIPQGVHIYRTGVSRSKMINDEGIRWLPHLLLEAAKIMKKERIDIAYFTGGPFFPLLAGPVVKFLFRIPYVIDLRDPWKLARQARPARGFKARLGHTLTNRAEPMVIRSAAKVICTTRFMQESYQRAYPGQKEKFLTIMNGYDLDDFTNVSPKVYNEFAIVYAGKFRRSEAFHNPAVLFQAMKLLQARGIKVRFVHVGAREEQVVALAESIGIGGIVGFVGPKSHAEAVSYAMGASLLLVIGSDAKMTIPAKLFDYVGCLRPILILGDSAEAMMDIGQELSAATMLENTDPGAIATAIEGIYHKQVTIEDDQGTVGKYTRRHLTSLLSMVLDEAFVSRLGKHGSTNEY